MENDKTIDYYNKNADDFVQNTVNAGMESIRDNFLKRIPRGGVVLDLGCGSGRDSKAFLDAGYKVISVDGSEELAKRAAHLTKQNVICCTFQSYDPSDQFDGIWACASLLHLSKDDIHATVKRLSANLKHGGCFYMSFKLGNFSGERNGRFFTDLNESSIRNLLGDIKELSIAEEQITDDVREGREAEKWLNEYFIKY